MTESQITGRVLRGIGEGVQFTALEWARRQFIERLGIDPYPGTLNLSTVGQSSQNVWASLRATPGVAVLPPDPQWCIARCYPVRIDGRIPGAIVYPEVPGYPDNRVELIAALPLREVLSLEDGDHLTMQVSQPLPVRAVIFDVDGTLVDSLEAFRVVAEKVVAPYGIEVTRADVCEAMNSNTHFWELVLPPDQPDRQAAIERLQTEASRHWPAILQAYGHPLPGLRDTLRALSKQGFRLGIVTGSRETAIVPLKEADLMDFFEIVITKNDVQGRKPDPEGLLLCARELNLAPSECVYVGDASPDIQAARAAGMLAVAVLTGAGDSSRLSAEGPDWIVASHAHLTEIFVQKT